MSEYRDAATLQPSSEAPLQVPWPESSMNPPPYSSDFDGYYRYLAGAFTFPSPIPSRVQVFLEKRLPNGHSVSSMARDLAQDNLIFLFRILLAYKNAACCIDFYHIVGKDLGKWPADCVAEAQRLFVAGRRLHLQIRKTYGNNLAHPANEKLTLLSRLVDEWSQFDIASVSRAHNTPGAWKELRRAWSSVYRTDPNRLLVDRDTPSNVGSSSHTTATPRERSNTSIKEEGSERAVSIANTPVFSGAAKKQCVPTSIGTREQEDTDMRMNGSSEMLTANSDGILRSKSSGQTNKPMTGRNPETTGPCTAKPVYKAKRTPLAGMPPMTYPIIRGPPNIASASVKPNKDVPRLAGVAENITAAVPALSSEVERTEQQNMVPKTPSASFTRRNFIKPTVEGDNTFNQYTSRPDNNHGRPESRRDNMNSDGSHAVMAPVQSHSQTSETQLKRKLYAMSESTSDNSSDLCVNHINEGPVIHGNTDSQLRVKRQRQPVLGDSSDTGGTLRCHSSTSIETVAPSFATDFSPSSVSAHPAGSAFSSADGPVHFHSHSKDQQAGKTQNINAQQEGHRSVSDTLLRREARPPPNVTSSNAAQRSASDNSRRAEPAVTAPAMPPFIPSAAPSAISATAIERRHAKTMALLASIKSQTYDDLHLLGPLMQPGTLDPALQGNLELIKAQLSALNYAVTEAEEKAKAQRGK